VATQATENVVRPPRQSLGLVGWLRANLFNTWWNGLITLLMLWLVGQVLFNFVAWAITAPGWVAVITNMRLFFVGRYPAELVWRVELGVWLVALLLGLSAGIWRGLSLALAVAFGALFLVVAGFALFLPAGEQPKLIPTPLFLIGTTALIGVGYALGSRLGARLRWPVIIAWLLAYPLLVLLIRGFSAEGVLTLVDTNLWGGLMLTLLLAVTGIVCSFPLGVLLALGRRSSLPIIKWFCVCYIELIRGVPLVTVLFMAQIMLPLFLPQGVSVDNLVRAMVAITLFSAAYLAENVRGGLQAIPRGQEEAARALGLNPVQTTLFITLPQALRAVIPVLVGQFISLFKDTSLVTIVGLSDLVGMSQSIIAQPAWTQVSGGVWRETFLFVAVIFWIFCFTMSRASQQIERNLNVGKF
jgi:general L-amino acid transport system permease protein